MSVCVYLTLFLEGKSMTIVKSYKSLSNTAVFLDLICVTFSEIPKYNYQCYVKYILYTQYVLNNIISIYVLSVYRYKLYI